MTDECGREGPPNLLEARSRRLGPVVETRAGRGAAHVACLYYVRARWIRAPILRVPALPCAGTDRRRCGLPERRQTSATFTATYKANRHKHAPAASIGRGT